MKLKTFEEIYLEVIKKIDNYEVSVDNLMLILENILEVFELKKKQKEPKKKEIIILLLKKIVNDENISESEKRDCNLIINNETFSNTIDSVINDYKNKNKLNKRKSLIRRILSRKNNKTAENLQRKSGSYRRKSRGKKSTESISI